MNTMSANAGFSRRSILILLASSFGIFSWIATREKPMAKVALYVKPKEKWTADHFYNFLKALPSEAMFDLKKSLGILSADANETQLMGSHQDARDIQKHALWLSSNVLIYPFRDETKHSYHDLTIWVCREAGIPESKIQTASTFTLERELHQLLFVQLWDKLTPQQRNDLLAKVDLNGAIKDKTAIAALSGAGAVAALSATVAFTGFAFYTTMSVTIATVASTLGVTLPFATYAGASTIVGVLSGPVGWAVMGLATLGGLALAGRSNIKQTTALIAQVHALKVEALLAAGMDNQAVFNT
jgi:hypothetical protein